MKSARTCAICGKDVEDPPLCYGADPPWRLLGIPEEELGRRVDVTGDQCVIDEKYFFLRGHIELVGERAASVWRARR